MMVETYSRRIEMDAVGLDVYSTCPFGPAEDPVHCHLRSCPLKLMATNGQEFCSISVIGLMSLNLVETQEALKDIADAVREIAGALDNGEWTAPITEGQ